jgi:hypothetical protein
MNECQIPKCKRRRLLEPRSSMYFTEMCIEITHILITNLPTSWCWTLLEKPPVVQLLKNFPAFYGTRRFNTVFTRVLHWSLSWARPMQSVPPYPICLRSILILSPHLRLGLPSGLLPSGFLTNILYVFNNVWDKLILSCYKICTSNRWM